MENSIKVVFVCVRCVVIFPPFFAMALLVRYRRRRGGAGRGKYIGAKASEAWQARTYYVGSANVSNL